MAEQYSSFQGRGPDIDVNLFVDAVTKGIAQGHASPNTATAFVQGASKGVDSYLDTTAKMQTIEAQAANNEVNASPEAIQARKDSIVARAEVDKLAGYNARLDKQVQESDEMLALRNRAIEQQLKQAKNEQALGDLNAQDAMTAAIAAKDPMQMNNLLQNKEVLGALFRNPKIGNSLVTAMKGAGADPYLVDNVAKSINEIELQKQMADLQETYQKGFIQEATENRKKSSAAITKLSSFEPLGNIIRNGYTNSDGTVTPFNPNKTRALRSGFYKKNEDGTIATDIRGQPILLPEIEINKDDPTYTIMYGEETLGVTDQDKGREFVNELPLAQLQANAVAPDFTFKKSASTTPAPSGINTEATGLATLNNRTNTIIGTASVGASSTPTGLSSEVLNGQPPATQAAIQQAYDKTLAKISSAPREVRDVVKRIESNPLFANQPAAIKALGSIESSGVAGAVSETGVKGILQVTGKTYDQIQLKYPDVLKPGMREAPDASILAGKVYFADMLLQIEKLTGTKDLQLAAAAYSALGIRDVQKAIIDAKAAGVPQDWPNVKPFLKKYVDPKTWEKNENYPEKWFKYFNIYNG